MIYLHIDKNVRFYAQQAHKSGSRAIQKWARQDIPVLIPNTEVKLIIYIFLLSKSDSKTDIDELIKLDNNGQNKFALRLESL